MMTAGSRLLSLSYANSKINKFHPQPPNAHSQREMGVILGYDLNRRPLFALADDNLERNRTLEGLDVGDDPH
jgi:hypothetical protein